MKHYLASKLDKHQDFLVYNADDQLDVAATLKQVPDLPDKTQAFFRDVPEWFTAGNEVLEGYRSVGEAINNLPEEERKKYTEEEIRKLQCALQRLIACNEMMEEPGLNGNQKEVLRCICYWVTLETIAAFPLTPEEEKNIF